MMEEEIVAIPVGSVKEERDYISLQLCPCGGTYRRKLQAVFEEKRLDRVETVCNNCGATRVFWFDISSFFSA